MSPVARTSVVVAVVVLLQLRAAAPAVAASPGEVGRIAFERCTQPTSTTDVDCDIYAVDADGGNRRALAANDSDGGVDSFDPAWSPDGRRIAFVEGQYDQTGRTNELWVMHHDGSMKVQVTDFVETGEGFFSPTWSPDAQQIAMVFRTSDPARSGRPGPALYVVRPDGSDLRRVAETDSGFLELLPVAAWSPDGSRIAVVVHDSRDDTQRINLVNPRTGAMTPLGELDDVQQLDWAPAGQHLLVQRGPPTSSLETCASAHTTVSLLSPEGVERNVVTRVPGCTSLDPAYSPDGQQIAISLVERGSDPPWRIYRMPSDGGAPVRVTGSATTHDSGPDWQPLVDPLDGVCAEPAQAAFDDLNGGVHDRAIACAADTGLASGTGGGMYAPAKMVTRGQMATFVARLIEATEVVLPDASESPFNDLGGNVHAARIHQLHAAGVINGVTATRYAPDAVVTRAQTASLLTRALDVLAQPLPTTGGEWFNDDDRNVHERNINAVATAGIASGTTPSRFAPDTGVRRDQMATFLASAWAYLSTHGGP